MKGISKFLTMAVVATAMASCSDDLGLNSGSNIGDGDMSATVETFSDGITRLSAVDTKNPYGTQGFVWAPNEIIRVFTLDKLSQDLYQIKTGAGTNDATFTRIKDEGLTGQKYAITEAQMIYGVSASDDNGETKPLLTVTLPREWTPGEDSKGNQVFPLPYWGKAEVTEGTDAEAKIDVSMKAMTGFLRVQYDELPAGTKYIVLTTHGALPYKENEGFMLVDPDKTGYADTKDWWYDGETIDATTGKKTYNQAQWIVDGYGEALTGTLNTFLEKDCELKVDERLVNSDEMIIKLDPAKSKIVYVPLVCNTYKNLHVIAAKEISTNYKYCYQGTEMKVFQDQLIERNHAYYLNANLITLGKASISALNREIALKNNKQGMTTIINVDLDASKTKYIGYADDRIYVQGAGSLVLNINSIASNYQALYNSKTNALEISDFSPVKGVWKNESGTALWENEAKDILRSCVVNFPSTWGDATADLDAFSHVELRTYTAILGTSDKDKAAKLSVDVIGPDTKLKETIELQFNDQDKVFFTKDALDAESKYAIRIKEGFKNVNILRKQTGDIFVHTNGMQAERETEVDSLDIQSQGKLNIRLQDALIKAVKFSKVPAGNERNVFTLGSTAIAKVYKSPTDAAEETGVKFEKLPTQVNGIDYAGDDTNTPFQVVFRAYWTGAALSAYAIENGYDVSSIYTAAQLASVGEGVQKKSSVEINSTHGYDQVIPTDIAPQVNDYYIPKALVRGIWLGDKTYPWIGAKAQISNFTFDGEGVELKNMTFLGEWAGANSWIDDPHWCCTSCWKPAINGSKIKIQNNIGLIRSVVNGDSVCITRVNLNDVLFDDVDNVHHNIGAIVGNVATGKAYFTDNIVSEDKINMNGDNVGGMVGRVWATKELVAKYNQVLGNTNNSGYVKSKKNNVGGAFGSVEQPSDTVLISNNVVKFDNSTISTISGNERTGGFIGNLDAKCPITVDSNDVTVNGDIISSEMHAGGFAGKIYDVTTKEINVINNNVNVTKGSIQTANSAFAGGMIAELFATQAPVTMKKDVVNVTEGKIYANAHFAGGMIGLLTDDANVTLGDQISEKLSVNVKNAIEARMFYAGGLIGQADLKAKSDTVWVKSADVTTPIISATEGYVGGEIGQGTMGTYIFGVKDYAGKKYEQNINVATYLSGKYAVGGLMGNNASSNATPVFVETGRKKVGDNWDYSHIVLNIKSFNQPKAYTDFNAEQKNYFGTMSNVLGFMQDDITFSGTKSTRDAFDQRYYLEVTDNLTGEVKEKVLYKYHGGQTHNQVVDPSAQLYWGDANGLVGWRASGIYTLDNNVNPAIKSAGESTDVEIAHNLYWTNGEEGATYNAKKTKLQ